VTNKDMLQQQLLALQANCASIVQIVESTLYAGLHVTAFAGTSPTLDVLIESDSGSGFGTASSRIAFTQNTGSIQSQWGSVNGAVTDTYWRTKMTIGGSGPSFTVYVTLGIGSLAIS